MGQILTDGRTGEGGGTRILFDITFSGRKCHKRPAGVLRTERGYAKYFLEHSPLHVEFCRFDRRRREYFIAPAKDVRFILGASEILQERLPTGASPAVAVSLYCRKLITWLHCLSIRSNLSWPLPIFGKRSWLKLKDLTPKDIYVGVGAALGTPDLEPILTAKETRGIKLVLLCHDLIQIKFTGLFSSARACRSVRKFTMDALRGADVIACYSECTKSDLLAFADTIGLARPATRVVPLGSDISADRAAEPPDGARRLGSGTFVLTVGTIEARKNHALLYKLWLRLHAVYGCNLPRLVIAGRIGRRRGDGLVRKIKRDVRLGGKVMVLLDAADAELDWLYRNCLFTVFPSHYEGWGLPVAESLAHGKYCIASSGGAIPEVTQGLVHHLDPEDEDAWFAEIERLLFDDVARARLEGEVRARYKPVTWEEAGAKLLECVRGVVPGGSANRGL